MFVHNFKYSLKALFRNKTLIFWTLMFPIILGTFFKMAFSNVTSSEAFKAINFAVVEDDNFKNDEVFVTVIKELSDEDGDNRIFDTTYVENEDEAKELLVDGKIDGYLVMPDKKDDTPGVTFINNGINQTIIKNVVEEIALNEKIGNEIGETIVKDEMAKGNFNIDIDGIYEKVMEKMSDETNLLDKSANKLDYSMIEFYTLIAMTCIYGGMLSIASINNSLANISHKGKRVSVAPTRKLVTVLSSLLASYVIQLVGLALLFVYTIFALNIDYGDNIAKVILLGAVGSLAGLAMGLFVGTVFKAGENAKTGILIAITMFFCNFAGMFGITMKYITDTKMPWLTKINPVGLITDGLYALYYYNTTDRFSADIINLIILTLVLTAVSFFSIRRRRYDSI